MKLWIFRNLTYNLTTFRKFVNLESRAVAESCSLFTRMPRIGFGLFAGFLKITWGQFRLRVTVLVR